MAKKHLVGVQLDLLGGPDVQVRVSVPKFVRATIQWRGRSQGLPIDDDIEGRVLLAMSQLGAASTATRIAEVSGLKRQQVRYQLTKLEAANKAYPSQRRVRTESNGYELEWKLSQ